MKSPVQKRSVIIAGHKTSVSLEQEFWEGLKEIARLRGDSVAHVLDAIATARGEGNLSSAIRVFVLDHFRTHAGYSLQRRAQEAVRRDVAGQAPQAA